MDYEKARIVCDEVGLSIDEVADFMDNLRDSGETNMFGAGPYLEDEFGVTYHEARILVGAYMHCGLRG
jgi:hypothetical protein